MQLHDAPQGATVVFGGQAGSEGKGAIVGHLARRYNFNTAICSFMTNAGHTWVGEDGEKVVTQQLPVAIVAPHVRDILIGPGSAITLSQLVKELNQYDAEYNVTDRLSIHPRAMIIEEHDAAWESQSSDGTKYLASTMKGCGRALARKVMRQPDVRLARDIPWLRPYIRDTTQMVNDDLAQGRTVLVEGSQGFDLDINHGIEYPYCTSRQTTPAQTIADCGISPRAVARIVAVLRTFPIRVGNVVENGEQVGYSGPMGGREVTFEEIAVRSGGPISPEYTTVTGRMRRIFEFDYDRVAQMVQMTGTTHIALTFADYLDHSVFGKNGYWSDLPYSVQQAIDSIENRLNGVNVTMVKSGPQDDHMFYTSGDHPLYE